MPTFRVDGLRIHFETRGAGAPVLLLHGFTSSLAGTWERTGWMELLARNGLRPVALDFRSHGLSDRVYDESACTTERLAADVAALLDHLRLPTASVFGFSMGGGIALRLAMDVPQRVERVAVAGVGDAAIDRFHDPADIAQLIAGFEAPSARDVEDAGARRIRRNAELAGNDLAALTPFLRRGGWPGGLREVVPVNVPALVIVAKADEYMWRVVSLLELIPQAELVRVGARGHSEVLHDEAVRRAVVQFLARPN